MTYSELSERFAKAPNSTKAIALLLITALFGAVFWTVFYSDAADRLDGLQRTIKQLSEEKSDYEDKKQKYMSFRAEVKKLLHQQKELIKVLPTEAEISSFLQSLHAQAELAGLNIVTFDKQPEVRKGFYAKIPVRMVISGRYHQITKFFYSVSKLKRIVNIQDVLLDTPKTTQEGVVLQAKFVASTFRFVGEPAAKPGQKG